MLYHPQNEHFKHFQYYQNNCSVMGRFRGGQCVWIPIPTPEKSQVAIGSLRNTGTDPLKKQLFLERGSAFPFEFSESAHVCVLKGNASMFLCNTLKAAWKGFWIITCFIEYAI